jgi:hypothetical protein
MFQPSVSAVESLASLLQWWDKQAITTVNNNDNDKFNDYATPAMRLRQNGIKEKKKAQPYF